MNPIKSKLTWDYFCSKVENFIDAEQDRLQIRARKTGAIIRELKKYVDHHKIINEDFWGYGIEQVSNGIKTIEQSANPEAGYLLTLFKLEADTLKFFFIRLTYKQGIIEEPLRALSLKLQFIEKIPYGSDSTINIYSPELDESLKIKADNVPNARYYSGEILRLKENPPNRKNETQNLRFIDKAKMVLQKLKEKPERKGDLAELLSELKIDYIPDDINEYANYFKETNYARASLSKDGCYLFLTNTGLDYIAEIGNKNVITGSTITAGGNVHIGDVTNNITNENSPYMSQTHSGSGDNVAGNKIERQINMGKNSTYIENQNIDNLPKEEKKNPEPSSQKEPAMSTPNPPLPETPSGFFGQLFSAIPKPINYIIAICLLGTAAYVAYHYFMPKKEVVQETTLPSSTIEKVYVSGRLLIDNGAPKLNEVKRLVLKNMPEVNSTRLDATGKFTFQNVKVPANKKLLVEVTFENGQAVPTEEITVNEVNKDDHTLYLPDLYADRPKPAKGGRPATGWSIKIINQQNIGGENNASQK